MLQRVRFDVHIILPFVCNDLKNFCIATRLSNMHFSFSNNSQEYHLTRNYTEDDIIIGMIFSSPEQNQKNLFRPNFPTNGEHVDYGFFARLIQELFDELDDGGYTDIVIDMPPNSDPYTDSIFDILLHQNFSCEISEDTVNLLLVSTYDRAHINANQEWCINLQHKDPKWKAFDSIDCYFNDVRYSIHGNVIKNGTKTISDFIITMYNQIKQSYKGSLYVKTVDFSENLSLGAIDDSRGWVIDLKIQEIDLESKT